MPSVTLRSRYVLLLTIYLDENFHHLVIFAISVGFSVTDKTLNLSENINLDRQAPRTLDRNFHTTGIYGKIEFGSSSLSISGSSILKPLESIGKNGNFRSSFS